MLPKKQILTEFNSIISIKNYKYITKNIKKIGEKNLPVMREEQNKSAQSASLGLPIPGASKPTSLQKFQASNATLTLALFIPGSPIADTYLFFEINPCVFNKESAAKF